MFNKGFWNTTLTRMGLLVLLVSLTTLACNLTRGADDSGTPDLSGPNDTANNQQNANPPAVQIFTPQDGQQVYVDDPVEVRVNAQHDIGVQRIQMVVDGQTVSSKALLDNPTNVDVLLSWTPDQRGSYTLEVQAFHGSVGSEAASVNLQVFPEGAILSNPASGQPQPTAANATTCTGRVLISNLNIRSGPGTSFTDLGSFDTGETISITGRNTDNRSREWFKIQRSNGQEAWVINNSDWIETSGNCDNLPTVD